MEMQMMNLPTSNDINIFGEPKCHGLATAQERVGHGQNQLVGSKVAKLLGRAVASTAALRLP